MTTKQELICLEFYTKAYPNSRQPTVSGAFAWYQEMEALNRLSEERAVHSGGRYTATKKLYVSCHISPMLAPFAFKTRSGLAEPSVCEKDTWAECRSPWTLASS